MRSKTDWVALIPEGLFGLFGLFGTSVSFDSRILKKLGIIVPDKKTYYQ